jgi:hypothetical protein
MTKFVEVKCADLTKVAKYGKIEYIGYIESPKYLQELHGVKAFQFFPNGEAKSIPDDLRTCCIASFGDTVEKAWEKVTQNKSLMADYGITQ